MKSKKVIPLFSSIFILGIVSCSGTKQWNEAGTSLKINYCLLQGQLDHNDSIERTRGVRDKLGTRSNSDDTLNENTQHPKVNNNFEAIDKQGNKLNVTITEIEHATMISTAGATWDSITANDTSTIWLNKHSADTWTDLEGVNKEGQSISMFISNNDGMAMGALGSVMWPKGMPMFGFDANENAVAAVKEGQMAGTIDSNSTGQVASCIFMIRNITDCTDASKKFTDEVAFANITSETIDPENQRLGYIQGGHIEYQSPLKEGGKYPRAMLSQGSMITKNKEDKDPITGESSYDKLLKYFDENGKIKTVVERAPDDEPNLKIQEGVKLEQRNVFMTYNNQTDTYFAATIKPLFSYFSDMYNVKITDFSGSGSDETSCLDAFSTAVNKEGYDAFIINMVKSSNGAQYLEKLKSSPYYYKNNKVTVPVIFWNKQPTDVDGNVDVDFMYDPAFSFVAYAGIDSRASGQTQGEMIKQWVIDKYKGNNY